MEDLIVIAIAVTGILIAYCILKSTFDDCNIDGDTIYCG